MLIGQPCLAADVLAVMPVANHSTVFTLPDTSATCLDQKAAWDLCGPQTGCLMALRFYLGTSVQPETCLSHAHWLLTGVLQPSCTTLRQALTALPPIDSA
jgi:hypothetical protein